MHYGGPTFINRSFCKALASQEDIRLEVLTTDADGPRERIDPRLVETVKNCEVTFCRRVLRPDIAPGLLLRLFRMIRRADIIHLNAVYSFTTIPTLAICRLLGKPVVWSPFGGLQRWEGAKRRRAKRAWEKICDSFCEPARVLLHVTGNEEKTESVEKLGRVTPFVLRNGIDIPQWNGLKKSNSTDTLRLLFMGRLHPIKGIENLLHALVLLESRSILAICGDGDNQYEKYLRSKVIELGLSEVITFHGRVSGQLKEKHFAEADICIVPSFKESFCTVVLESLARGVPVIASHGTPWETINEMGCGIWTGNSPLELAKAIDRVATLRLPELGRRGRDWMERDYSWDVVAEEMVQQYRTLTQLKKAQLRKRAEPQAI